MATQTLNVESGNINLAGKDKSLGSVGINNFVGATRNNFDLPLQNLNKCESEIQQATNF